MPNKTPSLDVLLAIYFFVLEWTHRPETQEGEGRSRVIEKIEEALRKRAATCTIVSSATLATLKACSNEEMS